MINMYGMIELPFQGEGYRITFCPGRCPGLKLPLPFRQPLRNENESGETISTENLKMINHLNIKMNKFKTPSNLKPERLSQFNSRATPWVRKPKPITRAESPGEKPTYV